MFPMGTNAAINLNVLYYSTLTPKDKHKHSAIQNNLITNSNLYFWPWRLNVPENFSNIVHLPFLQNVAHKQAYLYTHQFMNSLIRLGISGYFHTVGPSLFDARVWYAWCERLFVNMDVPHWNSPFFCLNLLHSFGIKYWWTWFFFSQHSLALLSLEAFTVVQLSSCQLVAWEAASELKWLM